MFLIYEFLFTIIVCEADLYTLMLLVSQLVSSKDIVT